MKIARYLRTLVLAAAVLAVPAASFAGIFISVGIAPPPLPVYEQPPIPGDGYLWTPGYWAWGDDGYFWVPGTWCQPPQVGFLWTPGYWGWNNGAYAFNAGYWGPHIGFYGGVNYGFGYGGSGYEGGYWNNGRFAYNRSVNNISNTNITNVYNRTVINNTTVNRTSFNGGTGGIQARPTVQEQAAVRENHVQPTAAQIQHVNTAQSNPQLRVANNGGRPAIAATATPGNFKSAVPARQAGGQVNTAVYKAAATNGGKLPANMKDPGGNVAASRPATPAAAANRPATANNGSIQNRPAAAATAARPAQQNTRPTATQANRPQTQPAQQARPQSSPAAAQRPAYQQPRAQTSPAAQPRQAPQQQRTAPAPAPRPVQQARPQPQQQHAPQPQHESAPHEGGRPRGR